jgi:hypothetical protein
MTTEPERSTLVACEITSSKPKTFQTDFARLHLNKKMANIFTPLQTYMTTLEKNIYDIEMELLYVYTQELPLLGSNHAKLSTQKKLTMI